MGTEGIAFPTGGTESTKSPAKRKHGDQKIQWSKESVADRAGPVARVKYLPTRSEEEPGEGSAGMP